MGGATQETSREKLVAYRIVVKNNRKISTSRESEREREREREASRFTSRPRARLIWVACARCLVHIAPLCESPGRPRVRVFPGSASSLRTGAPPLSCRACLFLASGCVLCVCVRGRCLLGRWSQVGVEQLGRSFVLFVVFSWFQLWFRMGSLIPRVLSFSLPGCWYRCPPPPLKSHPLCHDGRANGWHNLHKLVMGGAPFPPTPSPL